MTRSPEYAQVPETVDHNLQAEAFIADVIRRARITLSRNYPTLEGANEAKNHFAAQAHESIQGVPDIDTVTFRISGAGVKVPPIRFGETEASDSIAGVVITLSDGLPQSLDPFTTIDARFVSVIGGVQPLESGEFRPAAHFLMEAIEPEVSSINIEGLETPVARVNVFRTYFVECTNNSIIEIPVLEEKRQRRELTHELAEQGLARSVYRQKLNKLRSALYNEEPTEFKDLTAIELLHSIGRFSNGYARRGLRQSDLMSRSIMAALGKGRLLEVGGIPNESGDMPVDIIITGLVVDVLMPDSVDDTLTPTLVIETTPNNEDIVLFQFPLESISLLRF